MSLLRSRLEIGPAHRVSHFGLAGDRRSARAVAPADDSRDVARTLDAVRRALLRPSCLAYRPNKACSCLDHPRKPLRADVPDSGIVRAHQTATV